jgi:hypothetical protein
MRRMGLMGRIGHENPDEHLPWVNWDYEDLDCLAVRYLLNRESELASFETHWYASGG